jgi:hypothetical protein
VVYDNGAALQFFATLPSGAASQPLDGANASLTGGLASTFPALALAPDAQSLQLGSVYQALKCVNCGWTVNALPAFPVPSGGLLVLEPLNASAPRAAVGVAALTEQTAVRQAAVPAGAGGAGGFALALGPGAEFALGAGFQARTLIVAVAAASAPPPVIAPGGTAAAADLGFPSGGPGAALRLLGDALLSYHNKTRPAMNFDDIHAGLGISTTTFYFYNPCDCGRWANNTCPPDDGSNPGRLPHCMTYADTLVAVAAEWRARQIPFTHMLLDSFWYGASTILSYSPARPPARPAPLTLNKPNLLGLGRFHAPLHRRACLMELASGRTTRRSWRRCTPSPRRSSRSATRLGATFRSGRIMGTSCPRPRTRPSTTLRP